MNTKDDNTQGVKVWGLVMTVVPNNTPGTSIVTTSTASAIVPTATATAIVPTATVPTATVPIATVPTTIVIVPTATATATATAIVQPTTVDHTVEMKEETDTKTEEPDEDLGIYVVFSSHNLKVIQEWLKKYVPKNEKISDHIGPMRLVFIKGADTDRTLCVFSAAVYAAIESQGLTIKDEWTKEYRVLKGHIRKGLPFESKQRHLYVKAPECLTITQVEEQLQQKLKEMARFGVIPEDQFTIKIPFESRSSEQHVGRAFFCWRPEVSIKKIAVARMVLQDSPWDFSSVDVEKLRHMKEKINNSDLVRCSWSTVKQLEHIDMSPADRAFRDHTRPANRPFRTITSDNNGNTNNRGRGGYRGRGRGRGGYRANGVTPHVALETETTFTLPTDLPTLNTSNINIV